MQRTLLVLIILIPTATLVWYFFYTPTVNVRNYPPKNTTIVAFGDSLVEGVGGKEGGFVTKVANKIGVPIINLGKSGDTTRDGIERLPLVQKENPGIVILLLGGNDYLRQIPQEETERNLRTIIERLQADGVLVVLLGVRGGLLQDRFDEMYEKLHAEYNTGYVSNVLSGLLLRDEYMSDTIHPNDTGYASIAERVYTEIAPLLR